MHFTLLVLLHHFFFFLSTRRAESTKGTETSCHCYELTVGKKKIVHKNTRKNKTQWEYVAKSVDKTALTKVDKETSLPNAKRYFVGGLKAPKVLGQAATATSKTSNKTSRECCSYLPRKRDRNLASTKNPRIQESHCIHPYRKNPKKKGNHRKKAKSQLKPQNSSYVAVVSQKNEVHWYLESKKPDMNPEVWKK